MNVNNVQISRESGELISNLAGVLGEADALADAAQALALRHDADHRQDA